MSYRIIVTLTAFAALAILPGCERKAANEESKAQAAPSSESTSANPATTKEPEMVQIPGGKFIMGDKEEVDSPPHEVVVSPFLMDAHLVTQELFQKFMGTNPSRWKGGTNPVEQLRWSDAVKFCNKRSEAEGLQACYDLKDLEVQLRRERLPATHRGGVGIRLSSWNHDCLFLRR
jgi:formylglycine-generating enzyme required for sulfatase activity